MISYGARGGESEAQEYIGKGTAGIFTFCHPVFEKLTFKQD
jgi:hypothetical protein